MVAFVRILFASVGFDVEELKVIMIFSGIGLLVSLLWIIGGINLALPSSF
jgi:hypothetical protein